MREDIFVGQCAGQFTRRARPPDWDGLGAAYLPIPFDFHELSGFMEFMFDWLEEKSLLEDWPPPEFVEKPDVWAKEPFPIEPVRGIVRPKGLQAFALDSGHACNFHIQAGPFLMSAASEEQQRQMRFANHTGTGDDQCLDGFTSGMSAKNFAKRVTISITAHGGERQWAVLGPRLLLHEAPSFLVDLMAKAILDPERGLGKAWLNTDQRTREAYLHYFGTQMH